MILSGLTISDGGFEVSVPAVVLDGLILFLDAGNPASYPGSGNVWTDLSSTNSNATLASDNAGALPAYDSSQSGSLIFDLDNFNYATCPLTNLQPTTGITQSVWANLTTLGFGGVSVYIGAHYGNASSTDNSYALYSVNDTGSSGVQVTGGFQTTSSANIIITNTWFNLVSTYDGTALKNYFNGVEVSSVNYSGNIAYASPFPLAIGADYNNGPSPSKLTAFMDGRLSVVQLYNRGLSTVEVQQNFNHFRSRYGI